MDAHATQQGPSQFDLTEDQRAYAKMARDFADERITPHALAWDAEKYFPVDTLREAAALGMAGITVREDVGGSGLTRLDSALIFEALSTGCPAMAAYLSIHNMVNAMVDRYGSEAQRQHWNPGFAGWICWQATA